MTANEVRPMRTRRAIATVLVVVASLLAFLAILAIWLNRQALNTDNWTRTSSQLLEEPVVRDQVAGRLTDELFASVDVQATLQDALPPRAQALAAPAANALRTQAEKMVRNALERPDVQALWADANRTAHQELMAVLNGGGSTVSTDNGRVVLDVSRLLAELQARAGVGGRLRKALPASASRITLFQSSELGTAQKVVRILRPLPVVLILASVALLAVAIAIAPGWRRRAVRAYGIGFLVAGAGALLARSLAGDQFVTALASTAAAVPSVTAVWTISTSMLVDIAVATIGYGVVIVLGAWLAGPTRWATSVRRTIAPYLREPSITYAALALVVVVLVWWAPTPAWRNPVMVLILIGLLIAGVEALRRQVIREFPDATREDAARRHHERWERTVAWSRRRGEQMRTSTSRATQSASGAISATRGAAEARFSSPTTAEDARLEQLERLARLRSQGLLDDDELRAEKERILRETDARAGATH
jgi:hypothetical protein